MILTDIKSGDEVLCVLAELIKQEVRLVDLVARYGGEEFAIILPETSYSRSLEIAERIRHNVAAQRIACGKGQLMEITLSIGVATFPEQAATHEKLIVAADEALYKAKNDGRNRVCGARKLNSQGSSQNIVTV